jgi:hypothetical protein
MGWRFRHSFKVIPGVRLNLSKTGLSASIGGGPFTMNVGPRGVYGTASLPGSGISYRQKLGGSASRHPDAPSVPSPASPSFPSAVPTPPTIPALSIPSMPMQEVHSASTALMTSESLKELKKVIQTACEEHEDISQHLLATRQEKERATTRYLSWKSGFLYKRVFTKKFGKRKEESETADAKVAELEEQLRLTTIATLVDIAKEQAEPYFKMRDDFACLSECEAVWDIKSYRATDKLHERTTAEKLVERQKVAFSLGSCELLQWEQKVPHMQNAKGGDLFLYPGFILYRAAKEAFSVIDFHDVNGNCNLVKFQEQGSVPKDSKVIGQTWAKANKDGSPDKRFANNYRIPIVAYASLSLRTSSGLWEEFQFSNPERIVRFLQSWNNFVASFGTHQDSASQRLTVQ